MENTKSYLGLQASAARTLVRTSLVGVAAHSKFDVSTREHADFENRPGDFRRLERMGYVERVDNPARTTNRYACPLAWRATAEGASIVRLLPRLAEITYH